MKIFVVKIDVHFSNYQGDIIDATLLNNLIHFTNNNLEVINLSNKNNKKYQGLNALLSECSTAQTYFSSLPDYVQGAIQQREDNIQSEDELHRYAENYLQGDK